MRGMPFAGSAREGHAGTLQLLNHHQLLQQLDQGIGCLAAGKVVVSSGSGAGAGGGGYWEPTSVLDLRHSPSPSPPTSASTLSSSSPLADVAALAAAATKNVSPPPPLGWVSAGAGGEEAGGGKEEWVHQLTPLDMGLGGGGGDGWDGSGGGTVLGDTAAPAGMAPDNTFLRWIIGGEDAGVMDPPVLENMMSPPPPGGAFGHNLSPSSFAMEDTKPAVVPFGAHPPPNFLLHHPQPHAAFFGAGGGHPAFADAAPPPSKRHQPMAGAAAPPKLPPFPGGHPLGGAFLKPPKAEAAAVASDEAAAAVEQLAEAAKLAEAGDAFGAREILARLNYRLPAAPAAGTPLLRSAFYFKEALRLALSPTGDAPAPSASTPYDVVVKLGAYKVFSEISPLLQFEHLTCVQAVLDELAGAACIHVLDFDIGMGEQWASLMQELASQRRAGAGAATTPAALKVTALVSPASHHPLELQLIHENLSSFAAELGVFFQFAVYNIDMLDPSELLAIAAGNGNEAVAVHLPVGAAHAATLPAILRLVKRLGAKVVVAVDRGGDRPDMPLAAHMLNSLHSSVFLLDSIDAVGTDADTASKIERFLIQPSIEQCVVARHRGAAAHPPWRGAFAAAGFVAATATTFAESQAESLLNKVHVRGFRVEKLGGALCLYWQRGELVSVSAWRC